MSEGDSWKKYVTVGATDRVEAYLARQAWCPELSVSLPKLVDSRVVRYPPTFEWYALHYTAKGTGKWNDSILAWGLNITVPDLLKAQEELVSQLASSQRGASTSRSRTMTPFGAEVGPLGKAYLYDEAIEKFETLYSGMKPRFTVARVPRFWRESGILAFAERCSTGAREQMVQALALKTGRISSSPAAASDAERKAASTPRVRLNFDCLDAIFSWSGLKPGTMRALARVLGFNQAEIDCLIKRRCNPVPLMAKLVQDPEGLRSMMHDCDVVLVGSRAVGYFWPAASQVDADWRFITHPHVSHWLKFAAYLLSIGVKWDVPRDPEDQVPEWQNHGFHGEGRRASSTRRVLRGTLLHRGRRHEVELAAHPEHPSQQSSIQEVLKLHSSIAQCFITGFGAACLYAQRTAAGQSYIWKVGTCHDSAPREKAQREADKYARGGIDYVHQPKRAALNPCRIPEPRLRRMGDDGTLCVSFAPYTGEKRRQRVTADFDILRKLTWWEDVAGLEAVRQSSGSFWSLDLEDDWADRALLRRGHLLSVPGFDAMMTRLQCSRCRFVLGRSCQAHTFLGGDAILGRLLSFCLRAIERRRTSWSFLELDFNWSDSWEYPYV